MLWKADPRPWPSDEEEANERLQAYLAQRRVIRSREQKARIGPSAAGTKRTREAARRAAQAVKLRNAGMLRKDIAHELGDVHLTTVDRWLREARKTRHRSDAV